MKVLVATAELQGANEDDVCEAVEGELVRLILQPGHESCSCGRVFHGLASKKRTTTARVVDRPLTGFAYEQLLYDDAIALGSPDTLETRLGISRVAGEMLRLAASFPEDMVVERPTPVTVETRLGS